MSLSALLERRRRSEADDGFSLIEIVVTIMIIGVVMTAAAGFFINSLRTTAGAGQRQLAVNLVNKQIELAQGTPVAQLVAGRSQTAVTAIMGWSGAAAITAHDDTSNAYQKNYDPSAAAGSLGTVPTLTTTTQNKVAYTLRTYIDPCWLPVATLQSSTSTVNLACDKTYGVDSASTNYSWLYRVTVAAAWTGGPNTSCATGCTFTNSTLVDPSGDHKFNSNISTPTVTGISPSVIGQGGTRSITISGTNFVAGAIITLTCPDCTVGPTTSNSGTAIVVPITAGTTTGSYTVTVTNPDGGTASSASGALTVSKAPSNLSANPSSVLNYTTTNVTISGQNLSTGTLSGSGGTWTTGVASATQVPGTFVASATTPGSYPVTVTNTDQGAGTTPFTVAQSQPTISTISQGSFVVGVPTTVTITGVDYAPTGSVQVLLNGSVTSAIVGYSMSGTATTDSLSFVFTPTASTPSNSTFSVQNADGGTSATTPITIAAAKSTPKITSVPNVTIKRGTTGKITINGSGFVNGATYVFSYQGSSLQSGTATYVSSSQLTFNYAINSTQATGNYTVSVQVTNPDGGQTSASSFVVTVS